MDSSLIPYRSTSIGVDHDTEISKEGHEVWKRGFLIVHTQEMD
jgi:hypothetical protein